MLQGELMRDLSEAQKIDVGGPQAPPRTVMMKPPLPVWKLNPSQELEATALEVGQLVNCARRSLEGMNPFGSVEQRCFTFEDRAVVILAARITGHMRAPRSGELVRATLAFGTGLQMRAIGQLAIVALELPFENLKPDQTGRLAS